MQKLQSQGVWYMYHIQSQIYRLFSSYTRNKLDYKTYDYFQIYKRWKSRCKTVIIYSINKLTQFRSLKKVLR